MPYQEETAAPLIAIKSDNQKTQECGVKKDTNTPTIVKEGQLKHVENDANILDKKSKEDYYYKVCQPGNKLPYSMFMTNKS